MVQNADRPDTDQSQPDGASTGDFIAVLLRRKWVVVLIAGIGAGLGYLWYNKSAPVYRSVAQVEVSFKETRMPTRDEQIRNGESVVSSDLLATATVVVQSPVIIEKAVKQHNLSSLRSFASADIQGVIGAVKSGLLVTRGGDSLNTETANVLNISFRGPQPDDCQAVVSAILDAYETSLNEKMGDKRDETLQLIANASEHLTKQVSEKEADYRKWRMDVSPLLYTLNKGTSPHAMRLTSIESELMKVQTQSTELRARVQTIEQAIKENVVFDAIRLMIDRAGQHEGGNRAGTTSIVEQQLFPLMVEEQLLIESFGSDHPKVKVVRKQIQVLQDMVMGRKGMEQEVTSPAQFIDNYLVSLRTQIKALDQQQRELTDAFELEREAAKDTMNYEIKDEQMRSDIDRTRALMTAVTERLRELSLAKDPGGLTMRIIAKPTINNQKVEPVLSRSVAIGGVLGILVGIGLAYVIDLADKSFRTPDEIRGQLRLPVIGHIPVMDPTSTRRRKKSTAAVSKVDEMVACFHRPRSTVAEAYRSVRTALYFGTKGEQHKVLQVTSADAGDGKTTLVSNLAVSFAQSGKKICLVDADFRRSRLHSLFGVDNAVGMSSVMAGQAELPDAIHATEVENLSVLPCGPRPSNPSELLTSHRFKELLDVLRGKFDMILIDTPPLLAVTDPCAVAPRVDSVLLVMRITKNVRPNAVRAKEVLDGLGARVIGVVVNGVEMRQGYGHDSGYRRYGAGGYGYRDYDYGDYYEEDERSPRKAAVPTNTPSASA
jgi:capsular exopolysaccharide synthesis family protein